jgi:DNA-binding IclR family transcriptional regulator
MVLDVVDTIWSAMHDNELYSPSDLANSLEQPIETVTRVLEFLKKYKFADQVTRREMLFRKTAAAVGPGDALRVLQTLLEDVRVSDEGQVVSVSKINGNPKRLLDVRLGTGSSDPKMRTSLGLDG